jgi:hypothetical protein
MDDLISRQAVLNATSTTLKITGKENAETVYEYIKKLCDDIKALPSARQWIPCSERMPDIHEEVLICDSFVTQRVYTLTRISDDEVGWEDDYGFYHSLEDVEAWMPLPEPYRGENE